MKPDDFTVLFWGVRGSIPCSGPATARYGGNTASVEIRCGSRLLMFDAGTGIRYLGNQLSEQGPLDADLFLTHTHFDHVSGLPFFRPFFRAENSFRLWAGHLDGRTTLQQVLKATMSAPLFPVPPEFFRASMEFRDFRAGETIVPAAGISVRTVQLNHPDRATGYRVDYRGRSVCYLTDTEHVPGVGDKKILALINGAGFLIYDAMYTDAEYADGRAGCGHSTWQEGVRLCRAAGVQRLIVFHHDPDRSDDALDALGREIDAAIPGSVVAREGLVLTP
ncbi:MAG: MBL fold metallo-hydrolase [Pseudomonadota bacterium]